MSQSGLLACFRTVYLHFLVGQTGRPCGCPAWQRWETNLNQLRPSKTSSAGFPLCWAAAGFSKWISMTVTVFGRLQDYCYLHKQLKRYISTQWNITEQSKTRHSKVWGCFWKKSIILTKPEFICFVEIMIRFVRISWMLINRKSKRTIYFKYKLFVTLSIFYCHFDLFLINFWNWLYIMNNTLCNYILPFPWKFTIYLVNRILKFPDIVSSCFFNHLKAYCLYL